MEIDISGYGWQRRRHDEMTRHQEGGARQREPRNNKPARREDERVVRGATRGRGEVMRQQAGATS